MLNIICTRFRCNFWGYNPPPPLYPEYAINLSLNPAYVLNCSLKTVILCKIFQNWRLRTVYCMCCVPRTMPLRTEYALKMPGIRRMKRGSYSLIFWCTLKQLRINEDIFSTIIKTIHCSLYTDLYCFHCLL